MTEPIFDLPSSAPGPVPKDAIEELVHALADPIIVYPAGGWEDTIPEKLKRDVPFHRLAHLMKCQKGEASWDEATDLEALIYLYPASLAFPFDTEWADIYLYLGTKVYGDKFPQDIRQETLQANQMERLRDLKRWLYRKRKESRKRGERKEKVIEMEYEQLTLH